MAGIGFRLEKLLARGGVAGAAQAWIYSGIVATGPWLLSICGLALLGVIARDYAPESAIATFQAMVIYTYAASLILTGVIQMGATRYVADRLYVSDIAALAPCFRWLTAMAAAAAGAVALLALGPMALDWVTVFGGVLLFQAVTCSWVGMIFLTAAKDYLAIVRAFAIGYAAGVALGAVGSQHWGLPGLVWGFAIGQLLLVGLLALRIASEFPSQAGATAAVVRRIGQLPALMAVGTFLAVGIWIDKAVFWFAAPDSLPALGPLPLNGRYDTCSFLAYLTIVPAMAQFLIRVEVAFYRQYTRYYSVIVQGAPLERILATKAEMAGALRLSAWRLVSLQGAVSLAALVLAPTIVETLGLPPDFAPLLRVCILATFAHVLLQISLLIVLYFDWQQTAAWLAACFCCCNGALTALSLALPPRFHGLGYLAACVITLVATLIVLDRRFRDLEFDTFTRQPLYPDLSPERPG